MSAYMGDKLTGKANPYFIAVEPASCPSMTRGRYAYDFCDTGRITPLARMYTLGSDFKPSAIHAGGLRYHGMAPLISGLVNGGHIKAIAVPQLGTFEAAMTFARTEALIPAPESAHAIRGAIDEALDAKLKGEKRVILFNLSGHGYFDMASYEAYLTGKLEDYEYPTEAVADAMQHLPQVPAGMP
jgi:tryptophan synthase beta chain